MPMTVACKLPHGLTITHNGQTINLNGANADMDPLMPMANGSLADTPSTTAGYGLTTLTDDQAAAFEDYRLAALYKNKDGKPSKDAGMLEEPLAFFTNDTIMTFKDEATARKEVRGKGATPTGFDGIDGDAETREAAAGSGLVDAGKQQG